MNYASIQLQTRRKQSLYISPFHSSFFALNLIPDRLVVTRMRIAHARLYRAIIRAYANRATTVPVSSIRVNVSFRSFFFLAPRFDFQSVFLLVFSLSQ